MTAAETAPRVRVVDAGHRLFLEHGYVDTSIGTIAREAGVALQTIYSGFGSKVGVLAAVQDRQLAGDDRAVALLDRPWVGELGTLTTTAAVHRLVVELGAATARAAPVHRVVQAAASDAGVAALLDTLHAQRVETCRGLAARLVAARRDVHDLADAIYVLLGVETHDLLVVRRGWSRRRWQAWAEAALLAQTVSVSSHRTGE